MPRILRIINRFNLGGITFNVSNLSKYLEPEFETLLIGGEKLQDEASSLFIPENLGLKPRVIREMSREIDPVNDIKALKIIRGIIREFKPDIVHTHAAKAGALGRFAAWKEKVPVIVHTFHGHVFHSYFGKVKTAAYKRIERRLARRTDAIIALSETQKQELVEIHHICEAEKVHVIPLGFDLGRFSSVSTATGVHFRKKWNIPEDRIVVSIVGRLVPVKNHSLFIRAIQLLAIRYPRKITGVIVGDGSERTKLEAEKKICGLRDDELIFTSWIRETEEVYAGSDIVALTSFNEGTPVSLIEALAAGKPVVSTKAGGVEEIIKPGSGILVESEDADKFADALEQLILEPKKARELGQSGQGDILRRFNHVRLSEDTAKLYRSLLGQNQKAP